MIEPRHRTGCSSFDRATRGLLYADSFARTATQFSYRIPSDIAEGINDEGRRIPGHVRLRALNFARGGLLHEFGNPASNRTGWRTHGWFAVDSAGRTVGCWTAGSSGVVQKVIQSLRSTLFAAPSVPIGPTRFPAVWNNDRSAVRRQSMATAASARNDARIAREAKAASRRFAIETRRAAAAAMLSTLSVGIEDKLEALLEEA